VAVSKAVGATTGEALSAQEARASSTAAIALVCFLLFLFFSVCDFLIFSFSF
jgi:hypothetical protein